LLITITIFSIIILAYFIYIALTPSNVLEFESIDQVEILGYPMAIEGSIENTWDRNIPISSVTFVIEGKVIEGKFTYALDEVIENHTSDLITPGQTVDFYITHPGFKDEILIMAGEKTHYFVKVYYNGYKNDQKEYDVSNIYSGSHHVP
jgi:hypothetical protein